jgi:ATP-dependent Clp protease ATP-binding subunit ClpB
MDIEKYTQKTQEALAAAQSIASQSGHSAIEPEHLLTALIEQEEGVVPAIVTQIAGSTSLLHEELLGRLKKLPSMVGGGEQPGLSRSAAGVLEAA